MRTIFFTALLMLGFLVFVGYRVTSFRWPVLPAVVAVISTPSPVSVGRVEGAHSVEGPVANPILHVDVPSTSVFTPINRQEDVQPVSSVATLAPCSLPMCGKYIK